MKKKLIITETQLKNLKSKLNETAHSAMVKKIKEELDANYQPIGKFVREGGDYKNQPMMEVKVDGEAISPESLFKYLNSKYIVGEEFIKQVIRDWVDGKITDDYRLSKNVSLK